MGAAAPPRPARAASAPSNKPRQGVRLAPEQAFPPALRFLHGRIDGIGHGARNTNARRAFLRRGALHERQLYGTGALAVAAEIVLRIDPDLLDALGGWQLERQGQQDRKSTRLNPVTVP